MRLVKNTIVFVVGLILLSGCATSDTEQKQVSNSERARLLIEVANGSIFEKDPTGALQTLSRAEKLDPELPELHHSKAIAYFYKKEFSLAINSARRAIDLMPAYTDAYNTLGKLLLDQGNFTEAEVNLKKATQDPLYPDTYKVYSNLGILYYRKGLDDVAKENFLKSIESSPESGCISYYYLGHLSLKEKKFSQAITNYEKAARGVCSGFHDAHFALAQTLQRDHQYERARKKYLDITGQFPNTKIAEKALDHLRYLP